MKKTLDEIRKENVFLKEKLAETEQLLRESENARFLQQELIAVQASQIQQLRLSRIGTSSINEEIGGRGSSNDGLNMNINQKQFSNTPH